MTVRKALIERRRLHDKYQAIADRYQQSIKDNEETILKEMRGEGEMHVFGNTVYTLDTRYDNYDKVDILLIQETKATLQEYGTGSQYQDSQEES